MDLPCYSDSDMTDLFWQSIKDAETIWRRKIKEWQSGSESNQFFAVHSDAGIYIRYLAPKRKRPELINILRPPLDPSNQIAWMKSGNDVIAFLHEKGIKCFLNLGTDD